MSPRRTVMRFCRPEDQAVLELRHPRSWFFLFGPFYLLRLRLWLDAVVLAVGAWGVMHAAAGYVRRVTGAPARVDLGQALATLSLVRTANPGDPAVTQAMQDLVRMFLPIYAGAFALLGLMLVLAPLFPRYLGWRYASRGWTLAPAEDGNVSGPVARAGK